MKNIMNALCLVVCLSNVAVAQPHQESSNFRPPPRWHQDNRPQDGDQGPRSQQRGELLAKLHLKKEQIEKLRELRQEKNNRGESMRDAFEARQKLREALMNDDASDKDVMKQLDESNRALVEANTQRVKNLLALRKILTPEQRSILRKEMQDRKAEWQQGGPGGFSQNRGFGGRQGEFNRREGGPRGFGDTNHPPHRGPPPDERSNGQGDPMQGLRDEDFRLP